MAVIIEARGYHLFVASAGQDCDYSRLRRGYSGAGVTGHDTDGLELFIMAFI